MLPPLRIRANPPPPEQWTLVREYNMEERDSYEVYNYKILYKIAVVIVWCFSPLLW